MITPFYDSLLVKVTTRAPEFKDATRRMLRSLQEFRSGVFKPIFRSSSTLSVIPICRTVNAQPASSTKRHPF